MAIYAVGEGWTGALTQKYSQESIQGHFDESTTDDDLQQHPVMIYPKDDILQADAGWGCSVFLDKEGQVHMVGRPQDLMTLFRLNRMPKRIRQFLHSHSEPSETTIVGSMISKLIGFGAGREEEHKWDVARQYSLLHDWTKVDLSSADGESRLGDLSMSQIACSAGFMAMIGSSGTLYTLGINSRGQCGTGKLSNNEWAPAQVRGITLTEKDYKEGQGQGQPVVQVALGFQHGFALGKNGQIYSWGKGGRGQLGRELNSDQDNEAKPVQVDFLATQVAAGMHHGALLTASNQVYIWGKHMGRDGKESSGSDRKPKDARIPELLTGLPSDQKVVKISCGSHHTSILLEDGSVFAIGIASDEAVPILDPVQLVQPGLLEMPLRQFEARHDRTTMIDNNGQVYQVHLWKDESLRDYALFTPSYVDSLLDEGQSIESIHRGWLHTIIVTKPNS